MGEESDFMANLIVKNPPEFTEQIHKTEKEEFITADLENEIKSALLNNEVFLKVLTETIQKTVEQHVKDGAIHVTSKDKENWSGKASTAVATQAADGLESAADKRKLDGIATGAEVNQNAFSRVNIGDLKVTANEKASTIVLQAGSNITISADNASKKIVITADKDGGNADQLDGHHAEHFAAADHGHDGRYYTKAESDNLLKQKASSNHNHNGGKYLAGQGIHGGYSFANDGAEDTGMFSDADGDLYFMQNSVKWKAAHEGHTHDYIPTGASCNKNWNWVEQEKQPIWVWGGDDMNNMYVYNPRNFHVNYADSAGSASSASSASKLTINAGSSMQPVYFSNGVPVATSVRGVAIQSSTPSNTAVLWAW